MNITALNNHQETGDSVKTSCRPAFDMKAGVHAYLPGQVLFLQHSLTSNEGVHAIATTQAKPCTWLVMFGSADICQSVAQSQ